MTTDLRKHLRINVELDVDYESEHNFYAGATGNISEGGLFVACETPLPVGTKLALKLQLPGHLVCADAEVVWTAEAPPDSGGRSGMGLRFLALGATDLKRIADFVKRREPLLYEASDPAELEAGEAREAEPTSDLTAAAPEPAGETDARRRERPPRLPPAAAERAEPPATE